MQYPEDGMGHYGGHADGGAGGLYDPHRQGGLMNHHGVFNHLPNHVMGPPGQDVLKRDKDAIFG